jgi:FkbM family methyltransferase
VQTLKPKPLAGRGAVLRDAARGISGIGRFTVRELLSGGIGTYRIRGSDLRIVLRHRTSDVFAFQEIFGQRIYEDLLQPFPSARREPVRVVDLGANVGLFCARAARAFPQALITAVEPDGRNLTLLRHAAELNAPYGEWRVVEACADVRAGSVEFIADGSWASRVAGVGDPPVELEADDGQRSVTVPAIDTFELIDGADIVKMDIEGSEWSLLSDPRLGQVRIGRLLVEYHDWACPDPNPHRLARALLERAGLKVLPVEDWGPEKTLLLAAPSQDQQH